MATEPVWPVPAPSGRLTVPTVASRRPRVDAGCRPTAQQLADTARRVADTYPELLTAAEFDPTTFPQDKEDELVVRNLSVRSQRRVGGSSRWRLPVVLGRPVAVVAHTSAALMGVPGRVVGLVTLAEQTLTAM